MLLGKSCNSVFHVFTDIITVPIVVNKCEDAFCAS